MELSIEAKTLYEKFKSKYINNGYMYSGCISTSHIDASNDAILELMARNILQRRKCNTHALELTCDERKKLIREHKLNIIWGEKAPFFYPNDPNHGEVAHVMNSL